MKSSFDIQVPIQYAAVLSAWMNSSDNPSVVDEGVEDGVVEMGLGEVGSITQKTLLLTSHLII